MDQRIISFDAESNGLWGQPFSIGAVVLPDTRAPIIFYAGCPIEGPIDPWVAANVLPKLHPVQTFPTYRKLLEEFHVWLENVKVLHPDVKFVTHMGYIVEARLFKDMHQMGIIGDFGAPYPLLDVASNLDQVGEDPTSVDRYAQKYNSEIGLPEQFDANAHDPAWDALVAGCVYLHVKHRIDRFGGKIR